MADETVTLKVGGQAFEGWERVAVDRSLDTLAGAFHLAFTDRWPGHPEEWRIPPAAECQVLVGEELVLTGYTDTASYGFGDRDHPLSVMGRDKTADLVDCSAINMPGSWKGRRIDQIAADLAAPFGIAVELAGSAGEAFAAFAIQPGETVFAALDRMCKQRALLPITSEAGVLQLIQPATVAAGYELVLGENLKAARFTNDVKDRFSDYIVKANPHLGGGAHFVAGSREPPISGPRAQATDPEMPRHRPLLIVNQEVGPGATLSDRAAWEATTRYGRGKELVGTVVGWRTPKGELYRINQRVTVHARAIGVDDELLVKAVQFRVDARGGKVTELTLAPKEAYSLLAVPAKAKGKKKGKGTGVDPVLALS